MIDLDKMAMLPCPWCGDPLASVSVSEGSTFRWRRAQGCCTDGPEVHHDTMADDQQAAEVDSRRRAIEAWNSRAAPPGWKLVPVESDEDMQYAATDEQVGGHCHMCSAWACARDDARRVWDAMITAAPQPKDQTP